MGLYSDLQLNNGQYIPQYAGAPLKELQETAGCLIHKTLWQSSQRKSARNTSKPIKV